MEAADRTEAFRIPPLVIPIQPESATSIDSTADGGNHSSSECGLDTESIATGPQSFAGAELEPILEADPDS
jgi:hypothetical protein